MRQSRVMSLVEALANVAVGYAVLSSFRSWSFRCWDSPSASVRTLRSGSSSQRCRSHGATSCVGPLKRGDKRQTTVLEPRVDL